MEEDRQKIKQTVRKCTDRLGFVTEEQEIQQDMGEQ